MTLGPLKASHIKTGVNKKVEAAKPYTIRHADVCIAASPYEHTLIETQIHIMQSRKTHKADAKKKE